MTYRPHLTIVIVALALYLALALYQIKLPGLHYDEAKEGGLPAMQMVLGQPLEPFRGSALAIAGREWPLMVQDYIGALNAYLLVPFLVLGGVQVAALRWFPVLGGALTLLLTWDFARRFYSPRAGAFAALLLAIQPAFVFWNRQGIYVTSTTHTLLALSLWSGWRWWESHHRRWLLVTGLAWGLGLWAKLLFGWAVVGLLASQVLLNASALRRLIRRLGPADLVTGLGAFLLPLLPVLAFNVQTRGTFLALFGNLRSSYYGVNNLAFGQNLLARLGQFWEVLAGSPFWYLGGTFENPLGPSAFLAAGMGACLMAARRGGSLARRLLFPYLTLALILGQSCFTVSALWHSHFALLLPLPAVAVGGTADALVQAWPGHRFRSSAVAWAVMGLLAGWNLWVDAQYHRTLALSGGLGGHTDAIYRLAADLKGSAPSQPLAFDWGIAAPVEFLTGGQVRPQEVFGYEALDRPDPAFAERIRPLVREGERYHLFHAPDETIYQGRLEVYQQVLEEEGLQGKVVVTQHDRSGRLIFVVGKAVAGQAQ
ncbi:MAG: ArnT family glycosyltransferase [Anaerolineae bacterium]